MREVVIVPSDPIEAYEKKGTSYWLKDYFNPMSFYDKVYVLSPLEKEKREVYGLHIIPINSNKEFKDLLMKIKPLFVRAYGAYWATDYANLNRVKGIPVISSIHDTNEKLIFKSIKFSDHIICMSKVLMEQLHGKGIPINKMSILGNRVNKEVFHLIPKDNPSIINIRERFPKGKLLLHIGRRSYEKT